MSESHGRRRAVGAVLLGLAFVGLGYLVYLGSTQAEDPRRATAAEIGSAIDLGESGDLEGAVQALKAIVERSPQDTVALFNYGVALGGLARYKEADAVFRKIREINPKDAEAQAERAAIAVATGKKAAALDLLEAIPVQAEGMKERLLKDRRLAPLSTEPRMLELMKKHGLVSFSAEQR